jgi:hypothetical protein
VQINGGNKKIVLTVIFSGLIALGFCGFWLTPEIKASSTEILWPNAAGTHAELQNNDSEPPNVNFAYVDDVISDEFGTWVGADGDWQTPFVYYVDTYNFADHSVGAGTINSVTIYFRAQANSAGEFGKPSLITHSVLYYGTEVEISSSDWVNYSTTWTTNPNTGLTWTWAEIDALEAGVALKTNVAGDRMYCTQVYVGIDYTLGYEMGSTNYRIWESSVNSGGMDNQTSTSYRLRESIGEVGTGEATSTSYKLRAGYQPMLESYISLSVSTDTVAMLPSIGGISGGIATGTYAATVITDNNAGYSLYVSASTSPALKSISSSFTDYTAVAGTPDYAWAISATSSEFGFSPEGVDITQMFMDNSSLCATGTSDTVNKCWYSFATTTQTIASRYSSNHTGGSATTIKLQAQSGSSHIQESGTYQAQIITTAVSN